MFAIKYVVDKYSIRIDSTVCRYFILTESPNKDLQLCKRAKYKFNSRLLFNLWLETSFKSATLTIATICTLTVRIISLLPFYQRERERERKREGGGELFPNFAGVE